MTDRTILAHPLTADAFAPFGRVLAKDGVEPRPMNNGKAQRFQALAQAEALDGAVVISIAEAAPYLVPLQLAMVERHPLGSQAFMPLSDKPFLVVVCESTPDGPGHPRAFLTAPGQGIQYHRNTWHGVLTPIEEVQDFLIVDRAGAGSNLEEFVFPEPYEVHLPGMTA